MSHFRQIEQPDEDLETDFKFSSRDLVVGSKARKLGIRLTALIDDKKAAEIESVHLPFGHIDRLSSAGLNELIAANTYARNLGIRIVLVDVQNTVRDVFELTRLERMFDFESTTAGV